MAQELLGAFEHDLGGVTLLPADAGTFEIRLDGEPLFSHDHDSGFPEPGEMKRAIRDRL